jgi:hypothetical protein
MLWMVSDPAPGLVKRRRNRLKNRWPMDLPIWYGSDRPCDQSVGRCDEKVAEKFMPPKISIWHWPFALRETRYPLHGDCSHSIAARIRE